MSLSVEEGNKMISVFMEEKIDISRFGKNWESVLKVKQINEIPNYHSSWDWLMPACKKWDRLNMEFDREYEGLCDLLDNAVTLYDVRPAFNQLVKNIQWYTKQKQP